MTDETGASTRIGRRTYLGAVGGAALAGLAGCSSGGGGSGGDGGSGDSGGGDDGMDDGGGMKSEIDSYLSETSNYDSVTDMTGQSEVTVKVGAEGNGGNFAFAPAAIKVDPGTTVVWEWTGKGSSHNVAAEDDSFSSKLVSEKGHTFQQTFDSSGLTKYKCVPHQSQGMKGVVWVA